METVPIKYNFYNNIIIPNQYLEFYLNNLLENNILIFEMCQQKFFYYCDKFILNNSFVCDVWETNNHENIEHIEQNVQNEQNKNNIKQDPWDNSINDEKFYINNRIARIFPILKNYNNYEKIKIDDDSFSYITIREIAELITKIISHHLLQFNVNPQKSSIIDYTAGVGGNVLSFSKHFLSVHAIELSELRAEYLKNNIDVYGFKNITVYNESSIDFNENKMLKINPNVIFVDPPWGGVNYKNSESLTLKLGEVNIEELVVNIIDKFTNYIKKCSEEIIDLNEKSKYVLNNNNNKLIVLKLPKNYDIEYFYNFILEKANTNNYNIKQCLYILNKMLIVVIELTYFADL